MLVISVEKVVTLYLDYAKAFDKVDNEILIVKLADFGVSGKLFSLLEFFMIDRVQADQIDKSGGIGR